MTPEFNSSITDVNEMISIEILKDSFWSFQISTIQLAICVIVCSIVLWLLHLKLFKKKFGEEYEIDEATIGIGDQKIKIRPNYGDMQVAFKLWIELSTRKIGLPIDFENDIIVEVYSSWFEFFRVTRELIKAVPITKIRKNESTRDLVNIAIEVLNEGLRPHLTKWQGKFKKWYEIEFSKGENKELSPQQIQRKFNEYEQLIKEMHEVNQNLIKYREVLKKLAIGNEISMETKK